MTRYVLNNELKGIELYFDEKPEQMVIDTLKSSGWRWHNKKKCWYNKQSEETITFAEEITAGTMEKSIPSQEAPHSLRNEKCYVELRGEENVLGRDLTDLHNEPSFFNKTHRGLIKAWKAVCQAWTEETTMDDVMTILAKYNIKTHSYCAVD
jgi:hypothetical protein